MACPFPVERERGVAGQQAGQVGVAGRDAAARRSTPTSRPAASNSNCPPSCGRGDGGREVRRRATLLACNDGGDLCLLARPRLDLIGACDENRPTQNSPENETLTSLPRCNALPHRDYRENARERKPEMRKDPIARSSASSSHFIPRFSRFRFFALSWLSRQRCQSPNNFKVHFSPSGCPASSASRRSATRRRAGGSTRANSAGKGASRTRRITWFSRTVSLSSSA